MKNLLAAVIVFFLSLSSGFIARAQTDTTYWWNDAVFYEAFVRSFYDTNGDGIGDFKGLTAKLDYISSLGVKAIWLMPVCPSPTYHGYDITNYKALNPQYGTRKDYNDFIDSAHNRGIKVIFDAVMNHTSNQHPWFIKSSAKDTFYRNFYRWSATNPGAGWDKSSSGDYYYAYFGPTLPDINYADSAVKDSMFDCINFWLDSLHVDGFRCDAAPFIFESGSYTRNVPATFQFWKDFRTRYKSVNPNSMAVGEVGDETTDSIIKYTGDKFDFCFEFNLAANIIGAVNFVYVPNLIKSFQYMYDHYPFLQFGTFLSNHDQNRSWDQLGGSIPKSKVAAAIYLTLPGIPFVYYGEETGMTGSGADQNKRSPMQWNSSPTTGFTTGVPWESVNANYVSHNVQTETADSSSLLNWYKQLIAVRNENAILRRGTYQVATSTQSPVLAFVRSYQGQNLLVVINVGSTAYTNQTLTLTGPGIGSGSKLLSDLLSNNTEVVTINGASLNNLSVPAYGAAVYAITDYNGTAVLNINNGVIVYPNPVSNELNISLDPIATGKYIVSINDIEGREIKVMELNANDLSRPMDVSRLPVGMYIVHLSNNGFNRYFKVVKM